MKLRIVALVAVSILALGAAPAAIVSLPAGGGAWTATLQRIDADGDQSYLAIDSTGKALKLSSLAAPGDNVAIAPAQLAKLEKAVESARLGRWYLDDTFSLPVERPLIFRDGTGDPTIDTTIRVPAAREPLGNVYILTVARRTAAGMIETGKARWLEGRPTAEPIETFDIASTLRNAFQTRIASAP